MYFGIVCFIFLFCLPMAAVIVDRPLHSLSDVTDGAAVWIALVAVLLLAIWVVMRLRRPHIRLPTPRALASLDWPRSLTRSEMETYCTAWLRTHGWDATLASDPEQDSDAVYVYATRGAATILLLCDRHGEELNPATVRIFAEAATEFEATHRAIVTLSHGKLPSPAQAAARAEQVLLLRVTDLPQLDALTTAAAPAEAAPAAG